MTIEGTQTVINNITTYGPYVLGFISSVISSAAFLAAHLPPGGTSGTWYEVRKVIDLLGQNYGHAKTADAADATAINKLVAVSGLVAANSYAAQNAAMKAAADRVNAQ
jgi:hypothetical protein